MGAQTYSDFLNLNVKELLNEVKLDYSPSTTNLIDDVVSSIKQAIDRIPQGLQVTSDEVPGFVRDIGADKVEFIFRKPESIEIGGTYSYRGIANLDVVDSRHHKEEITV